MQKNLEQAINEVLELHPNYTLFSKGGNYAEFDNGINLIQLMFSYSENKWWIFIEHGSYNKGYTYQTLFYLS